jgi:FO synthase
MSSSERSDLRPQEIRRILDQAVEGTLPTPEQAAMLADCSDLDALMIAAAHIRDLGHGDLVSYSRKVFIPLTKLCRDVCSYCTFAQAPRAGQAAYLTRDEVLSIARAGQLAGCNEALFTLGDKPELRYRVARDELARLGCDTTVAYLREMAAAVLKETSLLPHLNPGVLDLRDIEALRPVSASMGIMLETTAERLSQRGGPHFGSPDKRPSRRLATIAAAGEAAVPFTSGILIGIGETRAERIDALLALRALNEQYGHLQEVIIQNFCAKPDTRMAGATEPAFEDHLWTIATARIVLGPHISIQAPPNLSAGALSRLIAAGINDWGGVSPVTPDHVNPEKPWPHIDALEAQTAQGGKILVQRLAIYPAYVREPQRWLDAAVRPAALRLSDASGLARAGKWKPGAADALDGFEARHSLRRHPSPTRNLLQRVLAKVHDAAGLDETEIVALFAARGDDFWEVCTAANALRHQVSGDAVAYVVNRNINYTNVCYFRCQFCAFSKGKRSENLRGHAYNLDLDEIRRRVIEAWDRGATEVCMQGGIHPDYTGATYLSIVRAVKDAVPGMHVHAFSPLEVWQGASTLDLPVEEFLRRLKQEGLGSLPGTAAEILDDEVREVICPDKVTTEQWLAVMRAAHATGLRSTATIMFGHVDRPVHWARHLLRVRALQASTGGFTEFVPLAFVPMETPIYIKGRSRSGPTLRESVLMHAVARLALHPLIPNIQTSWVKMGPDGAKLCLNAGANDIGGTLMNESITRAAGAIHGQEMGPEALDALIRSIDRLPTHRTSLYQTPSEERVAASYNAKPLQSPIAFVAATARGEHKASMLTN